MPVWDKQIERVKAAMWKHPQKGRNRYTIAIYRSYKDDGSNKWKNVYYFDRQDLLNIKEVCERAEDQILRMEDLAQVVGQD